MDKHLLPFSLFATVGIFVQRLIKPSPLLAWNYLLPTEAYVLISGSIMLVYLMGTAFPAAFFTSFHRVWSSLGFVGVLFRIKY